MKLAALALCLLAACSNSDAPPGDAGVRYTIQFAPGDGEESLKSVIAAYKERLAEEVPGGSFRADSASSAITARFDVSRAFRRDTEEHKLEQPLAADARTLQASGAAPTEGCVLARIENEWLRLERSRCERGLFGSVACSHATGTAVLVYSDALLQRLLGTQGKIEFLQGVSEATLSARNENLAGERARLLDWRSQHAGTRFSEFDGLAREQGGPLPGLVWRPHRADDPEQDALSRCVPLLRPDDARFRFENADLGSVGFSSDQMGHPAVSFEFTHARVKDFGDWTEKLIGQGMAVVLDEEILTFAGVRSRLPGGGIIEGGAGGFSKQEVRALVRLLRLSPLPLSPRSVGLEFLH